MQGSTKFKLTIISILGVVLVAILEMMYGIYLLLNTVINKLVGF